jgi:hypothetical protein
MSDGTNDAFADLLAFSFGFDRVRRVSFTPFLVRNWRDPPREGRRGERWLAEELLLSMRTNVATQPRAVVDALAARPSIRRQLTAAVLLGAAQAADDCFYWIQIIRNLILEPTATISSHTSGRDA